MKTCSFKNYSKSRAIFLFFPLFIPKIFWIVNKIQNEHTRKKFEKHIWQVSLKPCDKWDAIKSNRWHYSNRMSTSSTKNGRESLTNTIPHFTLLSYILFYATIIQNTFAYFQIEIDYGIWNSIELLSLKRKEDLCILDLLFGHRLIVAGKR